MGILSNTPSHSLPSEVVFALQAVQGSPESEVVRIASSKGRSRKSSKVSVDEPSQRKVVELRESISWGNPPVGWCEAVECKYKELVPDAKEQQRRQRVLDQIRAAVESCKNASPPCRLEVYGSFVSGMWSHHSDLDLTVVPVQRKNGEWSREVARSCINRYHSALKRKGLTSFELSEMRLRARVPVAVFEHYGSGVSCDLSFNNTSGVFKAHFLRGLKRIDPRFCELYMLVKAWARAQGLNDSAEGTFNSWCLAMLVIFYLQTRQTPAILPPISALFDSRDHAQQLTQNPDDEELFERHCELVDEHIGYGRKNDTPVGQLFLGFLDCMGILAETWLRTQCQRNQGRVNVWDATFCSGHWLKQYCASVEDPFDPDDNCARTITFEGLPALKQAMESTAKAVQHLFSTSDVNTSLSMIFWSRLGTVPAKASHFTEMLSQASSPGAAILASISQLGLGNPGSGILAALTANNKNANTNDPNAQDRTATPSQSSNVPVNRVSPRSSPPPGLLPVTGHRPMPPNALSLHEVEARQMQIHEEANNAVRLAMGGILHAGFPQLHFAPGAMQMGFPTNMVPQFPMVVHNT